MARQSLAVITILSLSLLWNCSFADAAVSPGKLIDRGMSIDKAIDTAIEQNRKGDFSVSILGAPAGTKVEYTLTSLDFDLGTILYRSCFLKPETDPDRIQMLDKIEKYFNSILVPLFWHTTEPNQNQIDHTAFLQVSRWAKEHGKKTFGHALFYGPGDKALDDCDIIDAGKKQFVQPWVQTLDKKQLEQAMKRYLDESLPLYEGLVARYTLNNETLNHRGSGIPIDYFSKKLGFKNLAPYFKWARDAAPGTSFYTNENCILAAIDDAGNHSTPYYVKMIKELIISGADVGGISIQGHFFGTRVPPTKEIWEKLDALSVFNLPILITEFGVQTGDVQQYAEDLHRFYRTCLAHPAVEGVIRWGIWEPDMWPKKHQLDKTSFYTHDPEMHLWSKDWTPNQAAKVYIDLVTKEWMTRGTGKTNDAGQIKFRGFYGTYRIDVAGKEFTVEFKQPLPQQKVITLP
ncbi:endo-1,4-beta-xylanase [Planctomycetota bacterium]